MSAEKKQEKNPEVNKYQGVQEGAVNLNLVA